MPFNKQIETRRGSSRLRNQPAAPQAKQADLREEYLNNIRFSRVLVYSQDQDAIVAPETTFKDFQKLPVEIQEEIYEQALPDPRTVEFFPLKTNYTTYHSDVVNNNRYDRAQLKTTPAITTPALLHVNSHSRNWARKFYQPCFVDYLKNKHYVFVDFSADTVILSANLSYDLSAKEKGKIYGKEYIYQIQNLAFDSLLNVTTGKWRSSVTALPKTFRGLRNVTYLKSGDDNFDMLQTRQLKNLWSAEAEKKRSGITCGDLNVTMLSQDAFAEEFGYDR